MQYPNNIQLTLAIGGDETKSIKGNAFDICILEFILYFLDRLDNTELFFEPVISLLLHPIHNQSCSLCQAKPLQNLRQ